MVVDCRAALRLGYQNCLRRHQYVSLKVNGESAVRDQRLKISSDLPLAHILSVMSTMASLRRTFGVTSLSVGTSEGAAFAEVGMATKSTPLTMRIEEGMIIGSKSCIRGKSEAMFSL
jgi:hypothetical protein